MEIRDYILTEEQLEQISRRPKKKKKSRKPHVEYRVLFQSGCDFGHWDRKKDVRGKMILPSFGKEFFSSTVSRFFSSR